MSGAHIELSIVSTLYRSEPFVESFVERCVQAAARIATTYEIILVNDCSPDGALQQALALQERHRELRIVDLSRNFGHHRALMTGLCFARGARVLLIDSDLEEDPAWLVEFSREMDRTHADVVYGVQKKRKGGFIERILGAAFYWIVNHLSDTAIQTNSVTARLMSAQYVAGLTGFQEREFAIGDLWVRTGFHQVPYLVEKAYRGETSYSLKRRMRNALLAILSTSTVPLKLIFFLGATISIISGIYIAVLLARYMFGSVEVEGWTSLILSVWFFGGMTLAAIGTIGIYIARIFHETKRRPYVVIRAVHDVDGDVHPTYPLDASGIPPMGGAGSIESIQLAAPQRRLQNRL
jgi:putative glycosyltransferase